MRSILQDVRLAIRSLARRPTFTLVVLATLALGIGANAAIFSVVRGILLRPLPYRAVDRVAWLEHGEPYGNLSEPEYLDYARELRAFAASGAWDTGDASLTGDGGEPERVDVAMPTIGVFQVLGVAPVLGRVFTPDEDRKGGPRVAVISHALWARRYGGEAAVLGRTITLDGQAVPVVGVMPERFDFPAPSTDVWLPLQIDAANPWGRNNHYLKMIARLAPGATFDAAQRAALALDRRWLRDFRESYLPGKPLVAHVESLPDHVVGATRPYLRALLGAVAFVLLIACVNVANLLLVRGEGRRRELAIRAALGASGARLARQLLIESLLLSLGGAALGLALAWGADRALLAAAPAEIPRLADVHMDWAVAAYTIAIAVVTGALFGLVPALRAARGEVASTLRDGVRAGASSGSRRTQRSLVAAEVALAVVMLAGAGLLVRTVRALRRAPVGFAPASVLTLKVSLPEGSYPRERAAAWFPGLEARIAAVPGVRAVGAMGRVPLAEGFSSWSIDVDGHEAASVSEQPAATPQPVTPGLFAALGIPIVHGRSFTTADGPTGAPVAIVNETMARELWPGVDPVGHTLKMPGKKWPWVTIVGVARDVRIERVTAPAPMTMYFPHAQAWKTAYTSPRDMRLAVRTTGDPTALVRAVRAAVRELEPLAPVTDVRTLDDVVSGSIARERFTGALISGFAGLALLLAGIGIYGVVAYGVSQRTPEIGVRMALGADRLRILGLVVAEGVRMAGVGIALGLAGAWALTRLMRAMLVGVSPTDPATFAVACALLLGVALLASLVPARRASAVSPTEALRGD